jgi:hypothetical protein
VIAEFLTENRSGPSWTDIVVWASMQVATLATGIAAMPEQW